MFIYLIQKVNTLRNNVIERAAGGNRMFKAVN